MWIKILADLLGYSTKMYSSKTQNWVFSHVIENIEFNVVVVVG